MRRCTNFERNFSGSASEICVSRYRESIFVTGYISFSEHLVDAAMKARSRWCFLPPSVSVDCQYLGKTARDGGIEQAGFSVSIRVSAHLLTRFDDRNLLEIQDRRLSETTCGQTPKVSGFICLNNVARMKIFIAVCDVDAV